MAESHHTTLVEHHKKIISSAASLADANERDAALISAFRGVTSELEAAEADHARATARLHGAKDLFDLATFALTGYKRSSNVDKNDQLYSHTTTKVEGRKRKTGDISNIDIPPGFSIDGTPLTLPPPASGGDMTHDQIVEHRDAFYQKLCGVPYSGLGSYTIPVTALNLRSRAQLDESIFIAEHWETGTAEFSVMDFRRQHKTFYTKMKCSKENHGRRTGHHVRTITDGRKVLCRAGKNDESLMYISMEDLYDALFDVRKTSGCKGWTALKELADVKYANIPQEQARFFVETYPVSLSNNLKRTSILA